MGVVFFLTFLPVIITVLAFIVAMAITGIVVLIAGLGGSIVSASVMEDRQIKTTSLHFFGSLSLLGVSCVAVLCAFFFETSFFIAPTLTIVGIVVLGLGIVGMIKAFKIERKVAKTAFVVLLAISALLGSLVAAAGLVVLAFGA